MIESRLLWPDRPIPELGSLDTEWQQPSDVMEWGAALYQSTLRTTEDELAEWRRGAIARLIEDAREHLHDGARYEIRQTFQRCGVIGTAWYRCVGGPGCFDSVASSEWELGASARCVDGYVLLGRCEASVAETWIDDGVLTHQSTVTFSKAPRDDADARMEIVSQARVARGFPPLRVDRK